MAKRDAIMTGGSDPPVRPTTISVVGSTGSIGTQTLDVVRANPDRYRVECLGAHSSIDALVLQVEEFRPRFVAVASDAAATAIRDRLPPGTDLAGGPRAFSDIATESEICVNGVVGFAGLPVTLAALAAGKRLALANKESLITAGPVVRAVRTTRPDAEIIPVDSEHCAIHQCLASHRSGTAVGRPDRVAQLVLTASGGPFRARAQAAGGGASARAALDEVTVDEALAHPTWKMGPKITIDSSTLMNKGLEVIEANELFGVGFDRIDVVVHPQSIVHSMVTFTDGATIAQLSLPDMRLPIAYALSYPDRSPTPFGAIDWPSLRRLDFEEPDWLAFPCLGLAFEAGRIGGTAPAWLNAANEVAVAAFLDGRIRWGDIAVVIERVLRAHDGAAALSAGDIIEADRLARAAARTTIDERVGAR